MDSGEHTETAMTPVKPPKSNAAAQVAGTFLLWIFLKLKFLSVTNPHLRLPWSER